MPPAYADLYRVMDSTTGRWSAVRYIVAREAVHESSISYVALSLADISRVGPDGLTAADRAIARMKQMACEDNGNIPPEQRARVQRIAEHFQAVANAARGIDGADVEAWLAASDPVPDARNR